MNKNWDVQTNRFFLQQSPEKKNSLFVILQVFSCPLQIFTPLHWSLCSFVRLLECSPSCELLQLPSYHSVSSAWLGTEADIVQRDGGDIQTYKQADRRPLAEPVRRSQSPMPPSPAGFKPVSRLWRAALFWRRCLGAWLSSHCIEQMYQFRFLFCPSLLK